MDDEKEYYNKFGVRITSRQVIQSDRTTIAISQVKECGTSLVRTKTEEDDGPPILGKIITGVAAIAGIIVGDWNPSYFFGFGIIGALCSVILHELINWLSKGKSPLLEDSKKYQTICHFKITTPNGESSAYHSKYKEDVDDMVAALNQAIFEKDVTNLSINVQQKSSDDKMSKIWELGALLKEGLLTKEEFDAEKKKILGS